MGGALEIDRTLGGPDLQDELLYMLARETGLAVASVDYRLKRFTRAAA